METAGLTDLLKQEGSYTIFAPTDEAFNSLTREDFELLKSEYSEIRQFELSCSSRVMFALSFLMTGDLNALRVILLYHFSNGIFINGGLEGGVTNLLKTLQGNNLQVLSVCTISHLLNVHFFHRWGVQRSDFHYILSVSAPAKT